MRYSRMHNRAETVERHEEQNGIAFFLAILAIAAVIYFVGAAKVGRFITDKVFTPVLSLLTGKEEGSDLESNIDSGTQNVFEEQGETFTLNLQAMHVYALQAGAYSDENNAVEYAQTLQKKGGAGYIRAEGDIYRVFIAAYGTQESAENVKQRLESEQGMQTKLYEITCAEQSLTVTADTATKNDLETVTRDMHDYPTELIALALDYDKSTVDKETAQGKIEEMKSRASAQERVLGDLRQAGITEAYITDLQGYYADIVQILEKVGDASSQTELSAHIKYAYMATAFAYNELAAKLAA